VTHPVVSYAIFDAAVVDWCSARSILVLPIRRVGTPTNLYCATSSGGLVKFGVSRDPAKRILDLSKSTLGVITIAFVVSDVFDAIERDVHAMLAPWRESGEWYRAVPAVQELVELVQGRAAGQREIKAPAGRSRGSVALERFLSDHSSHEACLRGVVHRTQLWRYLKGKSPTVELAARIQDATGGVLQASWWGQPADLANGGSP